MSPSIFTSQLIKLQHIPAASYLFKANGVVIKLAIIQFLIFEC
jgi:hypothetical protein